MSSGFEPGNDVMDGRGGPIELLAIDVFDFPWALWQCIKGIHPWPCDGVVGSGVVRVIFGCARVYM